MSILRATSFCFFFCFFALFLLLLGECSVQLNR